MVKWIPESVRSCGVGINLFSLAGIKLLHSWCSSSYFNRYTDLLISSPSITKFAFKIKQNNNWQRRVYPQTWRLILRSVRYGASWKRRTTHCFRKLCWRRYNFTSKRVATWLIIRSKVFFFLTVLKLELSIVFQLCVFMLRAEFLR